MRYVIKFTKEEGIKFLSHLDLMRTLQRIIKRSNIPVEYSKGFNPHMNLTIAQPLSVGTYSYGEYMDLYLNEELNEEFLIEELNKNSTNTIRFLSAVKVYEVPNVKRLGKTMAVIKLSEYEIAIKYNDTSKLQDEINKFIKMDKIEIEKETKTDKKIVDIKPLIQKFDFEILDNALKIKCKLLSGSEVNLSTDTLVKAIYKYTTGHKENAFVSVVRVELYSKDGDKFVTLEEFYEKFGKEHK